MTATIALKPKYVPLVQKPCCCAVTCLQMILYRRGFGLFEQEALVRFFKVKVSRTDRDSFNIKLKVFARLKDVGIKTTESEKKINRFFKTKRIPLLARAFRAGEISDVEEFIVQNLKKNNDVWMEYKTGLIHREMQKKRWFRPEWKGAHDNVIESIKNGKIVLVDPFWYYKPRLNVSIDDIKKSAIGFVVISKA